MAGLETRCIDEHKLRLAHGADTGDPVARGLRLARGDADFLSDQRIEQCGLSYVGLADNRNHAAALARHIGRRCTRRARCGQHGLQVILAFSARFFSAVSYIFCSIIIHGCLAFNVASMAVAADCSPARREPPMPRRSEESSGMAHSTSKVCLCAAPTVPTTRYWGSCILRPCSHSCNAVLASLAAACIWGLISTASNSRCTKASAGVYPASR